MIIANDPGKSKKLILDADRLAVAEKHKGEWYIFNGNEIAFLFADWIWKNNKTEKNKCYMIASTVSSKILRAMAEYEGFNFEETLTGFKWIGNKSVELNQKGFNVIFGYEVEIGFAVDTNISVDK